MKDRILVVDDDDSILDLLSALLESEGYEVQTFDSAEVAFEAALDHPPDAAIVDLMMPGMNGQDLIEALRRDPRTHRLPVLICSAYYEDLHRCLLELGEDDITHLRKPFDIEQLLAVLARMLSSERQQPVRRQKSGVKSGEVSPPVVAGHRP